MDTVKTFTTKDMAAMVGIAESTVRKYAQTLEKSGYTFNKDGEGEKATKLFTDIDAMMFKHLKTLREKTGVSLDKATEAIIAKYGTRATQDISGAIQTSEVVYIADTSNDFKDAIQNDIKSMHDKIDKLVEANKYLINRMEQQDKYIDESLNRRDENLMKAIRELQAIKQIAASKENEESKWWKFWK